ncbi:MAG: hypothetical protein ACK401_06320 [Archaeoglobaceae archaeon]
MFDARRFHIKTGKGSCIVKDKKVLNFYLLSEEEVSEVEKIAPLLSELPASIDLCYLETEKFKFGALRFKDQFVVFPVRTGSITEIIQMRSVVQNEG